MNAPELDPTTLTNSELIHLVELPPEVDGLRHYLTKAAKIEMLQGCPDEVRDAHLAAALERRTEHHQNLSKRRREGPLDTGAAIEARLGDETWSYTKNRKVVGGFRDAATGRKASVAYELVGNRSAVTLLVTRGTVEYAHAHIRPVGNWPPPRGRRPTASREARAAGFTTLADI